MNADAPGSVAGKGLKTESRNCPELEERGKKCSPLRHSERLKWRRCVDAGGNRTHGAAESRSRKEIIKLMNVRPRTRVRHGEARQAAAGWKWQRYAETQSTGQ